MIFVRTGPRFLFIRAAEKSRLESRLREVLGGESLDFASAVEKAGESETIIFILDSGRQGPPELSDVLLAPRGSSVVLTGIVNNGLAALVDRADLGPGLLLQRVPRDGKKVINTVQQHYGAMAFGLEDAITRGKAEDTVVVFTDCPLNKPVRVEEVIHPVLLVNREVPVMYRELRQEAVRYFTEGLETGQWHEVRINIYDTEEQYEIQYQRLALVLEDLEAGLILGEAWTRDHALALFAVLAYQVKLYTPVDPLELKQLLMGLEFNSRGSRFVDIDLYHRRKKIEKQEVFKKLPGDVQGYGKYLRDQLFSRLSPGTREKVRELEEQLESKE